MEIVILAAGKGSRFKSKKISNKCLIKIKGKSLVKKILIDSDKLKVNSKKIIVGFNSRKIKSHLNKFKVKFIKNNYYKSKDMMYSFKIALLEQKEDMIISYSDIYYSIKILKRINTLKKNNILLPVQKNWEKIWKKRKKDIYEDCESLRFDRNKILTEIGNKTKDRKRIMAQYMGLIFIPHSLKDKILKVLNSLNINRMHITTFLNLLCKKKFIIKTLPTNDYWYEFDDLQDLENFSMIKNSKNG